MFIRLGAAENNSPIQVFEVERKIIKHFDYQEVKTPGGALEETGKRAGAGL